MIPSAWKLLDWDVHQTALQQYKQSNPETRDPKVKLYEGYLILHQLELQNAENGARAGMAGVAAQNRAIVGPQDIQKILEEGTRWLLQKWHGLPEVVSQSHIGLLHMFQQFTELQESQQILTGLSPSQNSPRNQLVQEIKSILGTWRERLPNRWDDINMWNDLLSWRQYIFTAINTAFQQLVAHDQMKVAKNKERN